MDKTVFCSDSHTRMIHPPSILLQRVPLSLRPAHTLCASYHWLIQTLIHFVVILCHWIIMNITSMRLPGKHGENQIPRPALRKTSSIRSLRVHTTKCGSNSFFIILIMIVLLHTLGVCVCLWQTHTYDTIRSATERKKIIREKGGKMRRTKKTEIVCEVVTTCFANLIIFSWCVILSRF